MYLALLVLHKVRRPASEDAMLRITVIGKPESLTFQLEGRLAGPWVPELEHCCDNTLAGQHPAVVRFDLTGVTLIDSAGKQFLAAMHQKGAEFIASGCLMRAIVAEITRPALLDDHNRQAKENLT
jgi:anti-anti-sigma regulatory factor